MTPTAVNLVDNRLYRQGFPHEVFGHLRDRGAVHWHEPVSILPRLPLRGFWSVVRHAEVQQANRDWETFSAADGVTIQVDPRPTTSLVASDGRDHTRLRRLISAGFTPRMIGRLEDLISERTNRILASAAEAGRCDFVRDIAYQLPMHVIADIVGIPDHERAWTFERTDVILRTDDPMSKLTEEDRAAAQLDLFNYARELSARKRAEPEQDVWTLLANAEIEDDDGRTTRLEGFELDMFMIILAIAGSETTRNALTAGLMALLDQPAQTDRLRSDPALMPVATDEIIRWASPVLFFGRTATRDVELGDQLIRSGDRVVLWYPSANRDERAFADPFSFDIRRHPNPHVSFGGGGPHFCLGANLAKKEVTVMFGRLLAGYDVTIEGPPVMMCAGPAHNVGSSISSLPVRITPRTGGY